MGTREKSIAEINEKVKDGSVIAFTEAEFMQQMTTGASLNLADIDVVTTAFCSETSGTAAMVGVPVAKRGVFTRAKKLWLNGVLGYPGPAPNERLGLVEGLFFATQMSNNGKDKYTGAALIRDIIMRKEIEVECLSEEGDTYRTTFTLDQADFARLYVYNCFFRTLASKSNLYVMDRHLKTIKIGSKVLLNKSPGIVIGSGTRSTVENRSLSLAADMFDMNINGINGAESTHCASLKNSVALAIPILTDGILDDLKGCLGATRLPFREEEIRVEKNMAEHLKQLIEKGEFLLSASDMNLNDWFIYKED